MVKADSEFCLTGDREAHGKISRRISLANTRGTLRSPSAEHW